MVTFETISAPKRQTELIGASVLPVGLWTLRELVELLLGTYPCCWELHRVAVSTRERRQRHARDNGGVLERKDISSQIGDGPGQLKAPGNARFGRRESDVA